MSVPKPSSKDTLYNSMGALRKIEANACDEQMVDSKSLKRLKMEAQTSGVWTLDIPRGADPLCR